MLSRWQWLALLIGRRLWLRVTLFGVAGVVTAIAGVVLAPYVPDDWTIKIGANAIDGILNVLASSMLAVTVFSVSTMVAAFGAATNNVTPRATRLLMEDNTSKNVLGTFIGSFLFSLVGIIALSTGLYGAGGRAILLLVTIALIALIAVTILRWVDYLARFGRLGETVDRVEDATWEALEIRRRHPNLGGLPLSNPDRDIPESARPVAAEMIGYVQHVDIQALDDCAQSHGGIVYVLALPGTFTDPSRPIAMIEGPNTAEMKDTVMRAFTVSTERTYQQDPRFGLCVLGEIASRALSPAVNDPGTAIDVIGRAVRLLIKWASDSDAAEEGHCRHVRVPGIRPDDMLDDVFAPIARDGSAMVEIHVRLQKAFRAMCFTGNAELRAAALKQAALALKRAESDLKLEGEKDAVRTLAAENLQPLPG
jgi:uncharacterized membrane protein